MNEVRLDSLPLTMDDTSKEIEETMFDSSEDYEVAGLKINEFIDSCIRKHEATGKDSTSIRINEPEIWKLLLKIKTTKSNIACIKEYIKNEVAFRQSGYTFDFKEDRLLIIRNAGADHHVKVVSEDIPGIKKEEKIRMMKEDVRINARGIEKKASINFRIGQDLKDRFNTVCHRDGYNSSSVIRNFIIDYIEAHE